MLVGLVIGLFEISLSARTLTTHTGGGGSSRIIFPIHTFVKTGVSGRLTSATGKFVK